MKIKIFLKGVTRGQREFGESITVIINSVLLSIVYFVGIGFTSIFAKISGKHFLDLKTKKQKTYWEELNLNKEDIEKYHRQF